MDMANLYSSRKYKGRKSSDRSQATWFSGLYGCGEHECHDASVGIRKVLLTWWPRGKEKWRRKPESLVLQ